MATLEIHLFGVLALERDGQPLARLPSRRVRDLLAYLVITRDTRHPRDHLAGLFWGDQEDQKARHCLNTTLWRLNRLLSPTTSGMTSYLQIDAHSLGFNRHSDVWIDIVEFESCCQLAEQIGPHAPEQQCALYREALGYYTSDLLTGCYDDWCMIERERLHRLYIRALSRLMTFHTVRGEHDAAVEYGRAILAREGLHEDIHRDLMRIHLAAGNPAAALEQYRECEEILRRELGITPMQETQLMLHDILGHMTAAGRHPEARREERSPAASIDAYDLLADARDALAGFDAARSQLLLALDALERVVAAPRQAPAALSDLAGMESIKESEIITRA